MRKYLLFLLPLFLLAVFLFQAVPANAQYGLNVTAGKAGYKTSDTPSSVVTQVVNVALSMVYTIFFILVLYAGIRWMTAQGNEEHVTKAKNILEAAIIGLVLISAAYAITNFILDKVGAGNNTTNCTKSSDCNYDEECANGFCVKSCAKSSDCKDDEECSGGVCVKSTGTDKCAGVVCDVGKTCNLDTGACEYLSGCCRKFDVSNTLVGCVDGSVDTCNAPQGGRVEIDTKNSCSKHPDCGSF